MIRNFYKHSNALSYHSGLARWHSTKCSRFLNNKTRGTKWRDKSPDPKRETCDAVWQWVSCDDDAVKPVCSGPSSSWVSFSFLSVPPTNNLKATTPVSVKPTLLHNNPQLLSDGVRASWDRFSPTIRVCVLPKKRPEWVTSCPSQSDLSSVWFRSQSFVCASTHSCANTQVWQPLKIVVTSLESGEKCWLKEVLERLWQNYK